MRLSIDPHSGVPVYLQIAQGIKRSIALGSLREGEQLPSVREIAEDLTVNPNTVAKAYQHLEREQVVTAKKGVGTFVSDGNLAIPDRERRRVVAEMVDRALIEADHLKFDRDGIRALFEERLSELLGDKDTEATS